METTHMVQRFIFLICAFTGVAAAQSAPPRKAPPRKDIPAIAKAANGSVVSIVMSDKDGKPIAQGSGFVVQTTNLGPGNGAIVTNYHVIAEGSSAVAKLPDGDGPFYAVDGVLASDKARDIAIILAHGLYFRTLRLGNSDRVQVGQEVVAIGNPLSLESTVSSGIVSGIRTIKEEGGKFLQITAPISRGSSGGPLFNMAGEVIGITTAGLKGGENLNFAIPINDAKRLLLIKSAKLRDLPNEIEPEGTQAHDDAPPSASGAQSLKDTLQWMQNSLPDKGSVSDPIDLKTIELTDFSGCHVHFTSEVWDSKKRLMQQEFSFNLGDIDPNTISYTKHSESKEEYLKKLDYGLFRADTTNDTKKISIKNFATEEPPMNSFFIWFFPEYGARFSEAFRHAVKLCGGKPSAF